MSTAVGNYEAILNRSSDEVTEPGLYPVGTWRLRCVGVSAKENDDGITVFNFSFIGVEPGEDVDPVELEQSGDSFDGARIWVKRYIETKRDEFDLIGFFQKLGADTTGKTKKQLMAEVKGNEIMAYVGVRSYTNNAGELRTDNTAKNFAAIE